MAQANNGHSVIPTSIYLQKGPSGTPVKLLPHEHARYERLTHSSGAAKVHSPTSQSICDQSLLEERLGNQVLCLRIRVTIGWQ